MVVYMRSKIILFVVELSRLSRKEGRVVMLIGDTYISRLIVYVQHDEEEKLSDWDEYRKKKSKTGNEFGLQKSNVNQSSF